MDKNSDTNSPWWQPHLVLFFELSGWIAIPVLIGVYAGRWLDGRYDTEPWLFLISVGVAFIISMVGIVTKTVKLMDKITKENKKDEERRKPDGEQ